MLSRGSIIDCRSAAWDVPAYTLKVSERAPPATSLSHASTDSHWMGLARKMRGTRLRQARPWLQVMWACAAAMQLNDPIQNGKTCNASTRKLRAALTGQT
jgi:hypothetical protein